MKVPGDFCGIPGLVQLDKGTAVGESSTHGKVHVAVVDGTQTSGTMAGRTVAATEVDCNNGWGTADGVWAYAVVVAQTRGQDLVLDGEITPQYTPPGAVLPSLLGKLRFDHTGVSVTEHWYRQGDPTCCPSGSADTRWTWTGDGLRAGQPQVSGS